MVDFRGKVLAGLIQVRIRPMCRYPNVCRRPRAARGSDFFPASPSTGIESPGLGTLRFGRAEIWSCLSQQVRERKLERIHPKMYDRLDIQSLAQI